MSNSSKIRIVEIVTAVIHLFALTFVGRLLWFAFRQVQQSPRIAGTAEVSRVGESGVNSYYWFVATAVVVTLLVGGGPFAMAVIGRHLATEDGRRIEAGLAATFLSIGLILVFAPFSLPLEVWAAGGVLIGVIAVCLPVAVGYRYYSRNRGDATQEQAV